MLRSVQKSLVFCESPVWDLNMTWNGEYPQLTPCMSQTVLPLIPLIVLLLIIPYDVILVKNWSKKWAKIPYQWKICLSIVSLMLISICDIIKTLWQYFADEINLLKISDLFSPLIKIMTYLLIITLMITFRKNGYRNSASIPIFWLNKLMIESINLYSGGSALNKDFFEIRAQSLEVFISLSGLIISFLSLKTSSFESLNNESKCCPLHDFNVFSRIFYFWTTRLLIIGYKTKLDLKQHLMPLCYYLKSANAFSCLSCAHEKHNSKLLTAKSLVRMLWWTAWIPYLVSEFLEFLLMAVNFIQPYLLSKLIDFISGAVIEPEWHGLFYAIAFCLFVVMTRIINCQSYTFMTLATYRLKSSMVCAVYSKMLKLSPSSRRQYSTGEINNLMGVDIDEICGFVQMINSFYMVPIYLTFGIFMLWQYLGPSSLILLAVMAILGPVTTFIMRNMDKSQTAQMKLKDKRMEQISEILNNVKLLKLFAWEKPFMNRVTKTRQKELIHLKSLGYWSSAIDVLWAMAPMLVAGASFTVYTLTSTNSFSAKTAFVSLSIFNLLRYPMAILPSVLTSCIRAVVSFKRLKEFLSCEELNNYRNRFSDDGFDLNDSIIDLNDCTYTWSMDEEPVLKHINIKVPKGSLIAIVGRVGSGKSSLFSALLGDMYQSRGSTKVLGSLAYVPQSAWIQNTTLKQNITFVSDYNQIKYEKVVNACALEADFKILPAKDETEIGEKGINLSGGQKQRVSLARALYQDSDIYLLDDPLSAVDAHVAQHLFQHVIGPNGMLSNKTRLLATHHISFLKDVHKIIVIKSGQIIGSGSYDELNEKGLLSEEMLNEKSDEDLDHENSDVTENSLLNSQSLLNRQLSQLSEISRQISKQSDSTEEEVIQRSSKEKLAEEVKKAQLIDEEQQEFGNIKFNVYFEYLRRCGLPFIIVLVIAELLFNLCEVGANYWLNLWTSQNATLIGKHSNRNFYLSVYVSTILFEGIFIMLGTVAMYSGSIRAAAKLHKDMLFCILRTPLSFFDVTPMGRVINRFNSDMGIIDEDIPSSFMVTVQQFLWFPIIFITIWSTNFFMGIQIIIVNVTFYAIYKLYLWTSRQLKRLESIARSPVYSHFNESIWGAVSIRAYNVKQNFINDLQNRIDIEVNVSRHQFSTTMWVEMWTGVIGAVITFSTTIFVVLHRHDISDGLAAFVIIYSVEAINGFASAIRTTATLENSMVAVERVREYTQLDSEAEWDSNDRYKPNSDWPTTGRIDFSHYTASYRPGLDPVLKDLNLTVKSGEKVGIVGRTGAGKSSMALALFRIIEATNGRIMIDGIDVTKIGLHDLRSKLTIIPQEPNLFAGTLRLNLDPFNEHSNEKIWTALQDAHLEDFVSSFIDGLSHEITEGGDNLSAGQRQLVCLARALLRDTKILILDEATAACDLETDLLIQSTIKEKFSNYTILTIAHRLHTVLDYNTIIVLENGRIVEKGSPLTLLNKSDSMFYSLAKEAKIV